MNNHKKHIKWFHELGELRKSLPYELTKVFSDTENIEPSLIASFEHIERVFMFKEILSYEENDIGDFWAYLDVVIEETSYYLCMALPLVRQLIEGNKFSPVSQSSLNQLNEQYYKTVLFNQCKTIVEKDRIIRAYKLATLTQILYDKFDNLGSSQEMVSWAYDFSDCCAHLLLFYTSTLISKRRLG